MEYSNRDRTIRKEGNKGLGRRNGRLVAVSLAWRILEAHSVRELIGGIVKDSVGDHTSESDHEIEFGASAIT